MSQFGIYDPGNAENSSTLFSFQEVPVTSTKVNRWNGNIAAGFQLLQQIVSLISSQSGDAILTLSNDTPLKAIAASPQDMTVHINDGWAVIQNTLAGIDESTTIPQGGVFIPPSTNPRIDLIVLQNTGKLEVIEGMEAANPTPPSTPQNSIALAQVYLRPGSTKIYDSDQGTDSYIIDARPAFTYGDTHKHASDHTPAETPDGVRTQFSTLHFFRENTLNVYVNGILQAKDEDYSENADRLGYTFLSPPLSTYTLQHRYIIEREN